MSENGGKNLLVPAQMKQLLKLAGRDQIFRTSTSIQEHLARGEGTTMFFKGELGRVSTIRRTNG